MRSYSTRRSPFEATEFPYGIRLGVALFAFSGFALSQPATPPGATTAAPYDCSGQEGPALTSCKQLNAGALSGALVSQDPSRNRTHDCTGMSGSSLATCRELNGEPASPTSVVPGGYGAPNGGGYGVPNGGMTGGGAGTLSAPGAQPTALPGPVTVGPVPATNAMPLPASPIVPGNGQVESPSDRTEPVGPASSNVTQPAAVPGPGGGGASQKSGK